MPELTLGDHSRVVAVQVGLGRSEPSAVPGTHHAQFGEPRGRIRRGYSAGTVPARSPLVQDPLGLGLGERGAAQSVQCPPLLQADLFAGPMGCQLKGRMAVCQMRT